MKRTIAAATMIAALTFLGGCAPQDRPTYDQVRQETLDALGQVVDLIPSHGDIERTPEFPPYGCEDDLLFSSARGAFFTGQWVVAVEEDFDIAQFVDEIPGILPGDWTEQDLGVPTKEPFVYMVRKSPRMTLTIEETTLDSRKAVELLAMSRCGTEEEPQ